MKLSLIYLSSLLGLSSVIAASSGAAAFDKVKTHLIERREPNKPFANPELQKRASQYLNAQTESVLSLFNNRRLRNAYCQSEFRVDGTKIPDVDFDVGESYAGLLPISQHPHETRKLFFWYVMMDPGPRRARLTPPRFFPSTNKEADEITMWCGP